MRAILPLTAIVITAVATSACGVLLDLGPERTTGSDAGTGPSVDASALSPFHDAAAQPVTPDASRDGGAVAPPRENELGKGEDVIRDERRGTCVTFSTIDTSPTPLVEVRTAIVHSTREARAELRIASGHVAAFAAGLAGDDAELLTDVPLDHAGAWLVVRATNATVSSLHGTPTLLPKYQAMLAASPSSLVDACGDGLIASNLVGGRLVALVRIATSSPDERADVEQEAALALSFDDLREALRDKKVQVWMHADGATVPATCSDLACLASSVQALQSTKPEDGVVVERTVVPYDELGLENSPPRPPPPADAGVADDAEIVDAASPPSSDSGDAEAGAALQSAPAIEDALIGAMEDASDDLASANDALAHPGDYESFDSSALGEAVKRITSALSASRASITRCFASRAACALDVASARESLPSPRHPANLVADPGFELQTIDHAASPPWIAATDGNGVIGAGADVKHGWAHGGDNNGFVFVPGNASFVWGRPSVGQSVVVTPHTRYVVSVWMRTEDHVNDAFAAARTDCGPNGTSIVEVSLGALPTRFHYRSFEVDSGESTSLALCFGLPAQTSSNRWVQMDDIFMSELRPR